MRSLPILFLLVLPACGGATPSPGGAPRALSPALSAAADRVKGLLARVDDAAIDQAFSPAFLKSVSRGDVKALFEDLGPKVGACGAPENVDADGNEGVVRLTCERAVVSAKIVAQAAPPHLMDGLIVKAKPR